MTEYEALVLDLLEESGLMFEPIFCGDCDEVDSLVSLHQCKARN